MLTLHVEDAREPAASPVAAPAAATASFADPAFVLCNGRSGSTLVRFLLDAHPELACPPETNLPVLCAQLATVWSLIEGAPLSVNRGDEPPDIPEAAIAGVRETMDRMVGSYLARRGKQRYCDKSLGTARYVDLLLRVYPNARFICLYRHPMDVVASGVEACPWGLSGYGFDPYIAATPGNAVLALANFWADNTASTLAVEERFPDRCFRLRYEDLVADPEATAARLFEFLGVPAVPGISERCFAAERERFGPADHKIWYTSRVNTDSVGRGWSVPTAMIPPHLRTAINELTGKLNYLAVDGQWGTTEPPADLRVPVATATGDDDGAVPEPIPSDEVLADDGQAAIPDPPHSLWLAERLRAGLATLPPGGVAHAGSHPGNTFVAVALTRAPGRPAEYWLVDLDAGSVTLTDRSAQENSDWDMIGALDAWQKVADGDINFSVALRSCLLRYCDNGEATPTVADTRVGVTAHLLGVANWQ